MHQQEDGGNRDVLRSACVTPVQARAPIGITEIMKREVQILLSVHSRMFPETSEMRRWVFDPPEAIPQLIVRYKIIAIRPGEVGLSSLTLHYFSVVTRRTWSTRGLRQWLLRNEPSHIRRGAPRHEIQ